MEISKSRNITGRTITVDGMLLHQWRLKNVAPKLHTYGHHVVSSPVKSSKQAPFPCAASALPSPSPRKKSQRPSSATTHTKHRELKLMRNLVNNAKSSIDTSTPHPGLSTRMALNKKCQRNLKGEEHRRELAHMHRRMKIYRPHSAKTKNMSSSAMQSPRTPRSSSAFKRQNTDRHPKRVGSRSNICPSPRKPRMHSAFRRKRLQNRRAPISKETSVNELLLRLGSYLRLNRLSAMDFFETNDSGGSGCVAVDQLRNKLLSTDLGYSQSQITHTINAFEKEEDGESIHPVKFESLLRRVRWEQPAENCIRKPKHSDAHSSQLKSEKRPESAPIRKKLFKIAIPCAHLSNPDEESVISSAEGDSKINATIKRPSHEVHVIHAQLLREIVKKRMYRASDLEELFTSTIENATSSSKDTVSIAIESIRKELEI